MVQPSVQWLLSFKAFSLQSPGISNRESKSPVWPWSPMYPLLLNQSRRCFCPFCLPPGELFLNIVNFIAAHFSKEEWQDLTKAKSPECRRVHRSSMNSSVNKGKVSLLSGCWCLAIYLDAYWMLWLCEIGSWHHHPHLLRGSPNSQKCIHLMSKLINLRAIVQTSCLWHSLDSGAFCVHQSLHSTISRQIGSGNQRCQDLWPCRVKGNDKWEFTMMLTLVQQFLLLKSVQGLWHAEGTQ